MSKRYSQCNGITSKGIRCKINAPSGYCHYHVEQSEGGQRIVNSNISRVRQACGNATIEHKVASSSRSSPIKETNKNGYIYIYTLTRLLGKDDKKWSLKVRNLPNVSSKHRDTWIPFKAEKSPYMLIKVGMTTQNVQRRLKQWEDKCHHQLTCLHPHARVLSKSRIDLLINKFKQLSVDKEQARFWTYQEDQLGFFCPRGVNVAEAEVHKMLIAKYGSGDVFCTGCNKASPVENGSKFEGFKNKLNAKEPFQNGYNIHVEWFLIPKRDLDLVYRLIDSVCYKHYS